MINKTININITLRISKICHFFQKELKYSQSFMWNQLYYFYKYIVFGALARNFFAFDKSSLRDKIIALSGHLVGGRGGSTFGVNTTI
ncbi:hypothetical protein ALC57_16148 [Trachymyrmex cornetzi]|uniref:Uncharacterized protein n=1 Tax=Trachymyrmex cornetzi TaxID=471704 RepID=A0A151IVB8_9HYME|nr:hypothetical protein ALC57_16148 [Trachymyrmex cornetzi]